MTPADRPDERGQRVSDAVVESICRDGNQHLALDLRDERQRSAAKDARIAELERERDEAKAETKRFEIERDWAIDLVLPAEREQTREFVEALEWYGENARLCRLIHSEGDAGRHALSEDGGNRAARVLADYRKSDSSRTSEGGGAT